jgi:Flp pilus assembly pilin Flp
MVMRPNAFAARLFREESGQDLIEYALLTAFIGLAGAAAWSAIAGSLEAAYTGYDNDVQGIYEPLDPGATP